MKLSQLQEARYSGEHPLITKIKDAIDRYKKTTIQIELPMDEARDLISTGLGEPKAYPAVEGSFAQYEWTVADPTQRVGYKKQLTVSLTDQRFHAVVHIMPSFY